MKIHEYFSALERIEDGDVPPPDIRREVAAMTLQILNRLTPEACSEAESTCLQRGDQWGGETFLMLCKRAEARR